jgi:Flp pilus assembly protein TadD
MDNRINYRLIIIFILFGLLSGCNALNTKDAAQEKSPDLKTGLGEIAEIETQAQEAYANKNWSLAEESYIKLINKLPNESQSWFRLGNIYARTNRHDAAINAYRTSLNLNIENTKVWNNLGIVQLREATNTFVQMQQHMKKDDPLSQRTDEVVEAMTQLLEQGFSIKSETDKPVPDSKQLLKMDSDIH